MAFHKVASGGLSAALVTAAAVVIVGASPMTACCPAARDGEAVVNADQTVIMVWDAKAKQQHFIRQASFKSNGDDFGFLIPTPSVPELAESGDEAFAQLKQMTAPEVIVRARSRWGAGFGCSSAAKSTKRSVDAKTAVTVLQEKLVAGFNAKVLETTSATALADWLKENGYAYSPAIAAWAKPYVEGGWKITALKVAKDPLEKESRDVAAKALRLSFATERPLFPYREPDMSAAVAKLQKTSRLLRVYFLSDAKYRGSFDNKAAAWSGNVAWAGRVNGEAQMSIREALAVPQQADEYWWLTEFEDRWPYATAPGDVYFAQDPDQAEVERPAIIRYVDDVAGFPWGSAAVVAIAIGLPAFLLWQRRRRDKSGK